MAPSSWSKKTPTGGTARKYAKISPDSVMINLTGEDQDEPPVESGLHGARKRLLKNEGEAATIQEPNKKIKTEPSDQKKRPPPMYETDGVAVVGDPANMDAVRDDEDKNGRNTTDVEVVATKNHTVLPHMRQHCTVYPFSQEIVTDNNKFCDLCYCYICDIPASECRGWELPRMHCMANDTGPFAHKYLARRNKHKEKVKKREALKGGPNYRHCQAPVSNKCQSNKATRLDWCQTYGRVALAKDLGKNQAELVKPNPENEILLGTAVVPFTLYNHNPRTMVQYEKSWATRGGQPGWEEDPQAEAREFFMHRIGPRPKIKTIVEAMSCRRVDPVETGMNFLAGETEAVILQQPEDVD